MTIVIMEGIAMKLSSVAGWIKKYTIDRKRVIISAGILVIAIAVVAGIILYVHLRNHSGKVTDPMENSAVSVISDSISSSSDSVSKVSSGSEAGSYSAAQTVAAQSVSLDQSSQSLCVGQTTQLTATVAPGNAVDKNITWSSSDKYTASVSNGQVKAEQSGTAYIYAKTSNGLTAKCKVVVTSQSTNDGGKSNGTGGTGSGGSGGGSSGGGSSSTSSSPSSSSSSVTTGANLAGLATYGAYSYPYGVSETNPEFQKNEWSFDCNKIVSDITNEYVQRGYSFDTNIGNIYRSGDGGALMIRGKLNGEGQTHVVDIWVGTNSTGYIEEKVYILD
jgi:hypothetical protein